MATISSGRLPIPESTVVGTGMYTIPANKYGYLQMNVSGTSRPHNGPSAGGNATMSEQYTGGGGHNTAEQWVVAGDVITTVVLNPTTSGINLPLGNNFLANFGYARVLLNAVIVCDCYFSGCMEVSANIAGANGGFYMYSSATSSWSVSLFPIPINNLPDELIEGN